uniref:Uncharacterized protein n=1 Tax=Triticum urartu TaxID=4572 RepID=A0A8R7VHM8_TRIUA
AGCSKKSCPKKKKTPSPAVRFCLLLRSPAPKPRRREKGREAAQWKATQGQEETMQWYFVAALLTVLTSSQGIWTTLSQSNGKYKYDYATIPFLAEFFKLSVSSFFLWKE